MPSLLHKLQHKHHHHSSSTSSASSSSSSPKLETLTLSPATSTPSSAAATGASAELPSSSSASTSSSSTGLKSILRTSTVSSASSSSVDNELVDGQRSGASTPRTSVVGSGSSPAASINGASKTRSLNSDYEVEESLGCRSIKVQGQSCCYAIVAFSKTNVLQFINLPHSLHVPIIEAVRASWPKGVSSHGTPKVGGGKLGGGETIVDVWECHLNGLVWGARGTRGGVAVRRLISQLLSTLSQHSWVLAASIDASFKDSSKDTLYLKRIERPPTTIATQFFSMSFQDDDTIWIIDAPRAVIESVEEAVGYAWPQGVQKSGPLSKEPGCWAIQIKGTPWSAHSHSQQISSRLLHLHLLRAVYVQGFQLKGSISLADKDEGEMDSLFFESRVEGDD